MKVASNTAPVALFAVIVLAQTLTHQRLSFATIPDLLP